MKTFKVYKHPTQGFDAVKTGFSWPALFFGIIWMLAKKIWVLAGLWFGAYVILLIVTGASNQNMSTDQAIVTLIAGLAYWVLWLIPPFNGNRWREENLSKRSYELLGTVQAETPDSAIAKVAKSTIRAIPTSQQALNFEDAKTLFDRGQALRVKSILETDSPQDLAEAFALIKKSAEQGFSKAQHMLGYMYNKGEGTDRNEKDACRWCLLSAQQGDPNGQAYLGSMLADENCIFHSYSEAAKWLLKAAEQGSDSAQTKLGGLYYEGLGVQKNYSEAAKWYRLAEAQGCIEANHMLGVMRMHGEI